LAEQVASPTAGHYAGRFAPSPTGPLHAGSLVAALGSYLDARHNHGRWLVRIDDIDPPRAVEGAEDTILRCLDAHGFDFDTVERQSEHSTAYDNALQQLDRQGLLFRCQCTRATLGSGGMCISNCATEPPPLSAPTSLRIQVPEDLTIHFLDRVCGAKTYALGRTTANFILRRRDGLYAYQLAAAVDDGAVEISHVVRGADLLDSTPRQVYLQQCLGLTPPAYAHLPVITDSNGTKLSKQTGALALDEGLATTNLRCALRQLGQDEPPKTLTNPRAILGWAIQHWSLDRVPR